MSRSAFSRATSRLSRRTSSSAGGQLPLAGKRRLRAVAILLNPTAKHRLVQIEISCRLGETHAPINDQMYRFPLELAAELSACHS
jgi:hypothetical protein